MPMSPSARTVRSKYTSGSSRWATSLVGSEMCIRDSSDGKPFGSTYDITFDESGNTLTLTSATGVAETGVYVRAAIPDGVKNGAAVMKSSRTVPIRLL